MSGAAGRPARARSWLRACSLSGVLGSAKNLAPFVRLVKRKDDPPPHLTTLITLQIVVFYHKTTTSCGSD